MTETPHKTKRTTAKPTLTSPVPRETLGVIDAETERVLRATWPDRSIEAADFRRICLEIYGSEARWRKEVAEDLVRFRPKGKGGRQSGVALDRSLIRRWAAGEKTIPPWVGPALMRIPSVAIGRMRAHIEHLRSQVVQFDAELVEEERRMDGVLRGWVSRYVEPPAVLEPPTSAPVSSDVEWPAISSEDFDAAFDAGHSAYESTVGLLDEHVAARPEHPEKAVAWDIGWREANERHRAAHAAVAAKARSGA